MMPQPLPSSMFQPQSVHAPDFRSDISEVISTIYGQMVIPRFELNQSPPLRAYGHGLDHGEIAMLSSLLLRRSRGDRVFVDGGANIGTFSFGLRPVCSLVVAFEPQPVIAGMLAGSVALNNWSNVVIRNAALGAYEGTIEVPQFDYSQACSFGSIEFGGPEQREPLTQQRQHHPDRAISVPLVRLDDFHMERIDLLKLDVEGMEIRALIGAVDTIERCRPAMFIEYTKIGEGPLMEFLSRWPFYNVQRRNDDFLCIPS